MAGKTYQFTGRTVTVPNSKLFTANVENNNFFKAYIFEDVRVGVQYTDVDPIAALEALKEVAEVHFAPHRNDAAAFNRKIRRRAGTDVGPSEPVFDLTTSELGHYQFHVRFFVPTRIASNLGLEVSRDFLGRIYELRKQAQEKPDPKGEEEDAVLAVPEKD
ncbi:MAG: hypothetical protein DI626_09245 [Micavibrio aeruginosavorus]|uniref:Uncharacterized protein n=1 Tax=Micavibrio aeruginosavorus TaxID=349221 RepID=A0A2W4ZLP9_9BACT|nr:MAG: hypothetical protein DI626_09245 [Micavibrio aeruginosavorus]